MTTLRERLLALADDCELIRGDLVLAAARIALDAALDNVTNKTFAYYSNEAPHEIAGSVARQLTDKIRALRDGLD